MFKNGVVLLPIKIIRERDRIILSRPGRFIQDHDPVGIRIRQRPKQDGVDDAEDRGVRTDTESERQDCDGGKRRIVDELPQRKPYIIHIIQCGKLEWPGSFGSQGDDWVDARSAAGWDAAGEQRDCD